MRVSDSFFFHKTASLRYTPMKCAPIRYMPMRHMPARYIPTRCMLIT